MGAAGAELGEDAAPVGVGAVEGALDELAGGDGAGGVAGVVGAAGAADDDAGQLRRAFGVGGHGVGEAVAHLGEGLDEGVEAGAGGVDRRVAGGAVGEDEDGVVGAGAAVDDECVEGVAHGPVEGVVERGGGGGGVGGEDGEHGRHRRGEHGCAFGHAADGVVGAVGVFGDRGGLFGDGVGGEHRGGGRVTGFGSVAEVGGEAGDAGGDGVDGQRDADEAGGADEHVGRGAADRGGGAFAHGAGVVSTGFAGGGVGVPRVDDHCRGVPVAEVGSADLDGRGGGQVGGEHPGGGDGTAVVGRDEREVGGAVGFDAARAAGGVEPGDGGDAHGMIPTTGRPVGSGSPRMTLAAWMACPDAPLTRLSSAPKARMVPVRSS